MKKNMGFCSIAIVMLCVSCSDEQQTSMPASKMDIRGFKTGMTEPDIYEKGGGYDKGRCTNAGTMIGAIPTNGLLGCKDDNDQNEIIYLALTQTLTPNQVYRVSLSFYSIKPVNDLIGSVS
jgi:hypothetical protein